MTPRLNYLNVSPQGMNAMFVMEKHLNNCQKIDKTLPEQLVHLLKTRVSQINGCAYCIDMHTKDARSAGESEQRLYALNAWRETPFYSKEECAALAWAEANTLIAKNGVTATLFEGMQKYYSDQQIVDLTLVITSINAWNRIALSFGAVAGSYTVGDFS
ncbi:MAG: carboxymuconolactone decarboxylase family protein [Colwellia sp.]|nr:carboxymuconolactone decarboxylase family protein [Colwellia sp.]